LALRIREREDPDRAQVERFLDERYSARAAERLRGVGTALLRAVEEVAARSGCSSLWLVTTNDNLDALRFYQRRGFRLTELHAGAVDDSHARLKPEIPRAGSFGIDLRDELVLKKYLVR
jgi:GNAT superfamily N-acetyltransferase